MLNFCTLFDSHYLSRGLAMYESLLMRCPSFHLYIYAFDEIAYDYLVSQNLKNVTVVHSSDFESEELLRVKLERNKAEYCWTCTPQVIAYSIEHFDLESCTYLDADIYFFSDPGVLIREMDSEEQSSVLITEHRYTPHYDQSRTSGIYCVQFMTFRRDQNGLRALHWWRDVCLEWCYARYEDGRFGDQKYLDDWPVRFSGVHVLKHLGGGVAPWNIQQYSFSQKSSGELEGVELESGDRFLMVFYHYQNFKLFDGRFVELGYYKLSDHVKKLIYKPYLIHFLKIEERLKADSRFARHATGGSKLDRGMFWIFKLLKRKMLGYMNFHSIDRVVGK